MTERAAFAAARWYRLGGGVTGHLSEAACLAGEMDGWDMQAEGVPDPPDGGVWVYEWSDDDLTSGAWRRPTQPELAALAVGDDPWRE